jgi:hypothetical protein
MRASEKNRAERAGEVAKTKTKTKTTKKKRTSGSTGTCRAPICVALSAPTVLPLSGHASLSSVIHEMYYAGPK